MRDYAYRIFFMGKISARERSYISSKSEESAGGRVIVLAVIVILAAAFSIIISYPKWIENHQ